MKRVALGIVKADSEELKVGHLLMNIVRAAPPGKGFDLVEVRDRFKVYEKIERAVDDHFVDLEDAEHALLKRAISEMSYAAATKTVVEIADRVMDAKEPPSPLPPATNN